VDRIGIKPIDILFHALASCWMFNVLTPVSVKISFGPKNCHLSQPQFRQWRGVCKMDIDERIESSQPTGSRTFKWFCLSSIKWSGIRVTIPELKFGKLTCIH
jgi:hypothetical protein